MTFSGQLISQRSLVQDESVFTLLIATYGVFSFLPMCIHAFAKVNPWILCIVIAL